MSDRREVDKEVEAARDELLPKLKALAERTLRLAERIIQDSRTEADVKRGPRIAPRIQDRRAG